MKTKNKTKVTITESQFLKRSYKSYMEIWYYFMDGTVPGKCMLQAIDFNEGLFKLMPYPDGYYEEKLFWAHYSHCQFPPRKAKMKIIK